jgi:hypothetical protein
VSTAVIIPWRTVPGVKLTPKFWSVLASTIGRLCSCSTNQKPFLIERNQTPQNDSALFYPNLLDLAKTTFNFFAVSPMITICPSISRKSPTGLSSWGVQLSPVSTKLFLASVFTLCSDLFFIHFKI